MQLNHTPFWLRSVPQYLSLGAGVQSSTIAFMADKGLIKPYPKAAIFADTQQEPKKVYEWLKYLQANIKNFPIIVSTYGDLGKNSLRIRKSSKSGRTYLDLIIPMFLRNQQGSRGILARRCTRDYKVNVVAREIRKLLAKTVIRKKAGVLAIVWIGISEDEEERKKPSHLSFIQNRWPLLELEMTRQDCLDWMRENHYPTPPRSSCTFCPYHSDATWLDLKNNSPDDFAAAVKWEKEVQLAQTQQEVLNATPYCHSSMIPLDQVVFNATEKKDKFNRTCEGMCGV